LAKGLHDWGKLAVRLLQNGPAYSTTFSLLALWTLRKKSCSCAERIKTGGQRYHAVINLHFKSTRIATEKAGKKILRTVCCPATAMQATKGDEYSSYSFLTSALDGVVIVTFRPRFTSGKGPICTNWIGWVGL
jgi:hypothetical protein